MTFSIAALCPRTGQIGIAATTAAQSVGKLACHAKPGVGAFASQARLNPYLAYDGLRLLLRGAPAEVALARVLASDPEKQERQAGVIDRHGNVAAFTGDENLSWAGHMAGRLFTTQGNRLVGPQVLQSVVDSMHQTEHLELAERLVLALQAGAAAGGDAHGERSINVMVFADEEYPLCDIRIDDHDQPLAELQRLFGLYQQEILPVILGLPKRTEIAEPP